MYSNTNHPNLVRVITDFRSDFTDELNCVTGDVVQIEAKLDKYWFNGYSNGISGKIPIINCQEIDAKPQHFGNYPVFAANNDFTADYVDGDLRFKKGDLIIGYEQIDENWWSGSLLNLQQISGIFPLTHVWKLDPKLLPKAETPSEQQLKTMFGKVLMDMKSQLDNEMDLFKDETIQITQDFDKMYFKGQSIDGLRVGIFPKNFVTIIENYQPIEQNNDHTFMTENGFEENNNYEYNEGLDNPPSYENAVNSSSAQPSSLGYSNAVIGEVESYGRTLFPFKAEFPNELSLKEHEIVHLIRHIDNQWIEGEIDGRVGIFPKDFIEIIVDCEVRQTDDQNTAYEFPADTFARVLYDFEAEIEGDLTVKKGDTLTLIRRIDTNWFEAMDDSGSIGFVANNICEIIDDIQSNSSRSVSTIDESKVESLHNEEMPSNTSQFLNVTEFDPIFVNNQENDLLSNQNKEELTESVSPKIPKRPAPSIPKPNEVSPHRPPPPVPKHRSQRHSKSGEKSESNYFSRQESIRSSIASNTSSNSSKSDTASASTPTVPSAEDLRRTEDRKKKVREQRGCVIMELLQTERDYKQNLNVCADIFLKNPIEAKKCGIDVELLFGNLYEIIKVSERLIRLLEENTSMKKYENQRVGKCFLQVIDDMKSAYSYYCKNHDQTQPLWDKYHARNESKQYLERGLDRMRNETNCFDIPSVLIKPVQRILKYPLLLNELYKCTEEGHEDRSDLMSATTLITDMAQDINEYKRRQDLVLKYRKESSNSFSSKFAKINLHTVMKKSSRLGQRITSTFGLTTITKDEEFSAEVRKFRAVEKTIKIFVKDQTLFMKSAQEFLNQGLVMVESISEYYAQKNRQQEVEQLRSTQRAIVDHYWTQFKTSIDTEVTPVLNKLLQKFSGPNNLIHKRDDKLLDYDSLTKKCECNKDQNKQKSLQEQQLLARNVYEALNSQLVEELPKLCDISMEILKDCIQAFLVARKQLIGRIARHHLSLLELPLVIGFANGSSADINETFHIKHNIITDQILDEISLIPPNVFSKSNSGFNALTDKEISRKQSARNSRRSLQMNNVNHSVINTTIGVKNNKRTVQSPSQRAYIQSRYKSSDLFESVSDYDPCDVLDIYVNKSDLIGVIKRQDPMGSRHKWFVDTGTVQGFVPSNLLIPYHDDSWVTPPSQQIKSSKMEDKEKSIPNIVLNQNQSLIAAQVVSTHQYKVHPSPEPPVQLRNDLEVHRYEDIPEDSPPRYSNLDLAQDLNYENLLLFDDKEEKSKDTQYYGQEFDPYGPVSNQSVSNTSLYSVNHRYEEIPQTSSPDSGVNQSPNDSTPTAQPKQNSERFFAAYPFTANDSNQLCLEFGQPVIVRHKSDLKGNTEWWFVEDREGNTGYVPANYLTNHSIKYNKS